MITAATQWPRLAASEERLERLAEMLEQGRAGRPEAKKENPIDSSDVTHTVIKPLRYLRQ